MSDYYRSRFLVSAVVFCCTATLNASFWDLVCCSCLANCFAWHAVRRGSIIDTSRWIDRGADIYHADKKGRTLLHEAVTCEKKTMAQWLIEEHGLDPLEKDQFGKTAVDLAEEQNCYQILNYLQNRVSFTEESFKATHDSDVHNSAMDALIRKWFDDVKGPSEGDEELDMLAVSNVLAVWQLSSSRLHSMKDLVAEDVTSDSFGD